MAFSASSDTSAHATIQQNEELEAQHPSTLTEKATSLEALPPLSVELSPPNGGLIAWMQVAASFCIFFSTWYINFHMRELASYPILMFQPN